MDEIKARYLRALMIGAITGAIAMFILCGYATDGFNTHPQSTYVVTHHCVFDRQVHTEDGKVIAEGQVFVVPPSSSDIWECPDAVPVVVSPNGEGEQQWVK